ncbi:hypothetical protein [Microbacterium sp.]|uniref:hypothetical protein n=1 Tax=Microbacterium sp. TaxID=51671 RepID=UPI003C72CCEE
MVRNVWKTIATRVNVPALVITAIIAVVGPLFVASYSLAMGDPTPREVPLAVVGDDAQVATTQTVMDEAGSQRYRVVEAATPDAARTALDRQQIYAIVDPAASALTLSTASGFSVAVLIADAGPALSEALGTPLTVVDAHPLAKHDQNGLVLFYLALGATILGFVGAIQTRVNAQGMTLRAEVGWDIGRSLVVSLLMTIVIGPVLGLEAFPVLPVWLVLAATMFTGAMVYSFWRVAIGRKWALLPTWITFVIIANPSAGGAVAPELLPPFYEFMGRWLPTGATVRALRDITYFPDALTPEPFLVLAGWVVASAAAFITARRRRYGTGAVGAEPRVVEATAIERERAIR